MIVMSTVFYFFQRYVTECVGVEFVGVCIITMGAFATLGGFGSGWLMRFTTSYVMVLVCIGGLEVGSFIFLIVWTRQPSFAVIVVISAVFGLCYGLNATVALGECQSLCMCNMYRQLALIIAPVACGICTACARAQDMGVKGVTLHAHCFWLLHHTPNCAHAVPYP